MRAAILVLIGIGSSGLLLLTTTQLVDMVREVVGERKLTEFHDDGDDDEPRRYYWPKDRWYISQQLVTGVALVVFFLAISIAAFRNAF